MVAKGVVEQAVDKKLSVSIAVLGVFLLGLLFNSMFCISGYAVKIYQHPFIVSNMSRNIDSQLVESNLAFHRFHQDLHHNSKVVSLSFYESILQAGLAVETDFEIIRTYYLGDTETVNRAEEDSRLFYDALRRYAANIDNSKPVAVNPPENIDRSVAVAMESLDRILVYALNKALVFKSALESEMQRMGVLLVLVLMYAFFTLRFFYKRNLTRLKAAKREVEDASDWASHILNATPEPILIFNDEGKVTLTNEQALTFFDYSENEIKELQISDFIPSELRHAHQQHEQGFMKRPSFRRMGAGSASFSALTKAGKEVPVIVTLSHLDISEGRFVIAAIRDVTKEKKAQEFIAHQAHYDQLTDLPNRVAVKERFKQLVSGCVGAGSSVALVYFDLDNFKPVNDAHGHEMGDKVLQSVAKKLQAPLRDGEIVSRFGGDEFIMLLRDEPGRFSVAHVLDGLISDFQQTIEVEGHEFVMSFSAGVAFFPRDGQSFSELSQKADTAMYEEKSRGGGGYVIHAPET